MSDFLTMNPHKERKKMAKGHYPLKVLSATRRTNEKNGSTSANVEFAVANGEWEGTKIYKDFLLSLERDPEGEITVTAEQIAKRRLNKKSKGGTDEEVADEVRAGLTQAQQIGNEGFASLINAAGFVNEASIDKDTKDGKKDVARLAAQTAWPLTDEMKTALMGGDYSLIEGKIVMASTKENYKGYQEPSSFWDYDPSTIGELAATSPI